jgi:hypothetical protein
MKKLLTICISMAFAIVGNAEVKVIPETNSFQPATSAVRLEAEDLGIVACSSGEASPINFTGDGYAEDGAFSGDLYTFLAGCGRTGSLTPTEPSG